MLFLLEFGLGTEGLQFGGEGGLGLGEGFCEGLEGLEVGLESEGALAELVEELGLVALSEAVLCHVAI